jgi:hypothetical protein
MKVINNLGDIYPEETLRFCDWERFEDRAIDCVFFNAGPQGIEDYDSGGVPKILLWFEEQTHDIDTTDSAVPHVDKILTILNPEVSKRTAKRQSAFYPTNEEITEIFSHSEKKYDVIYTGYSFFPLVDTIVNAMQGSNYRWVSFGGDSRTTDTNITYIEKLKLIAESKIDVCHGQTSHGTPQTKSRYFEAAFCRSLILMHKDQWNLIEEWFVPDVDFIYWENEEDLRQKIKHISENYQDYLHIVDNAYNKAMSEYTTEKFVEKYIGWKK